MSKISSTGLIFIILGLISGLIQNTFYGYVDAQEILRDSIFMPLAFILIAVGICLLVFSVAKKLIIKK